MNDKSREIVGVTEMENKKNEYSIFEYLIATPAVFIALASTLVALVTIMAKYITLISVRKKLSFWEIELTQATFGDESLVYTVVISIVFSLLTVLLAFLFVSTYEAYLSYKKNYLLVKYCKRNQKKIIKQMRKRYKKSQKDLEAKRYCEDYDLICSIIKKLEQQSRRDLFLNSIPILLLLWGNSFVFVISNTSNDNTSVWQQILVGFIVQIISLWILSMVCSIKVLNKRKMKKECNDITLVAEQIKKSEYKEYPIQKFFTQGIRSFLNNTNIVFIIIILLVNCFSLCITTSLEPMKIDKSVGITSIDDVQYAIVYQKGNQYFLEEAESEDIKNKSKIKSILTIYTNRQRIITTDDILINVFEYDDVKRDHKTYTE